MDLILTRELIGKLRPLGREAFRLSKGLGAVDAKECVLYYSSGTGLITFVDNQIRSGRAGDQPLVEILEQGVVQWEYLASMAMVAPGGDRVGNQLRTACGQVRSRLLSVKESPSDSSEDSVVAKAKPTIRLRTTK